MLRPVGTSRWRHCGTGARPLSVARRPQVDAFQLVVETPTPKKGSKPAAAARADRAGGAENAGANAPQPLAGLGSAVKVRPMSLGLSRRSSMVAMPWGLASARKSGRPSGLPRPSILGLEPRCGWRCCFAMGSRCAYCSCIELPAAWHVATLTIISLSSTCLIAHCPTIAASEPQSLLVRASTLGCSWAPRPAVRTWAGASLRWQTTWASRLPRPAGSQGSTSCPCSGGSRAPA